MESEGHGLECSRARGDSVDGSSSMNRSNIRSRLHLDVDWVDGGSNTQHSHKQPMPGSGNTAAADAGAGAGAGEAARHSWLDDGNHDGEDDAMRRNNSTTKEGTWKGLLNNDIYHVWNHGPKFEGGFHCRYCNLKSRGGGATRFREHLAGITGNVRECPNVPRNVRTAMRDSRAEKAQKKREKATRKLRVEREIIEGMYCTSFALVYAQSSILYCTSPCSNVSFCFYTLKIRAEEDQDHVQENYRDKEVDPCAMMMDTAMYDASNPMMEWLNEDEEHIISDGADAASAVFEEIRFLNSRRNASRLGTQDSSRKRKRVVEEEEEEDEYIDSEDDDEEADDIFDDDGDQEDSANESEGEEVPRQVEEDVPSQADNDMEVTIGSLANRRSARQ